MPIPVDEITRRKLILVRQLYQQAEKQSGSRHSIISRIMAVIGFDLTIETLLKVIVEALDQHNQPSDSHNGLVQQCEKLLLEHKITALPNRAHVIRVHSIRNDAQHKAKYPNETDISDCRVYARDFCREVIQNIWGVVFDELSQLDWIDDSILKHLLEIALIDIQSENLKKSLTLIENGFFWASSSLRNFLPQSAGGLYGGQVPELKSKTVEYINSVLKQIENTSKQYAAMISTGINPADYKRFREVTPSTQFIYTSDVQKPEKVEMRIQVYWQAKVPDKETAIWAYEFTVNSIISWQVLGLSPSVEKGDWKKQADALINWNSEIITMQ
jgi:hypothetical protein